MAVNIESFTMQQTILKKYAVKTFNDIIGQQSIVRFFKNSLYKNIWYPLYLLAGMRGTGKTTSARLFAAAALCDRLTDFQKNADLLLPCYNCDSCRAVMAKNHPDIIELDAASHTGVDTIRAIIDNAYVCPVLKEKKFYIIDEVHMLSKAAFNACLKIMEEPPAHVHFILATTEIQKVIDTIKSRSIILHFKPIDQTVLFDHIEKITKQENIVIEKEAIEGIIKIADCSVRDASNMLERLLMSYDQITLDVLYREYGYPNQVLIEDIFDALLKNDKKTYFEKRIFLFGIQSRKVFFELSVSFLQKSLEDALLRDVVRYDQKRLFYFLSLLYRYESYLLSSEAPFGICDLFLNDSGYFSGEHNHGVLIEDSSEKKKNDQFSEIAIKKGHLYQSKEKEKLSSSSQQKIDEFIVGLGSVLSSIFKQGKIFINEEKKSIEVTFKKNFSFYADFIESKKSLIQEVIQKIFGFDYQIVYLFKDLLFEEQMKESNGIERKQEKDKQYPSSHSSSTEHVPSHSEVVMSVPRLEKKGISMYEKKMKKVINSEYLPQSVKKITLLFPGTTYIKEE